MKVSLRKANDIQQAIHSAIGKIFPSAVMTISIHEEHLPEAVEKAQKHTIDAIESSERLNAIRYDIRKAIANANASYGIEDLIVEHAKIKSSLSRLSKLVDGSPYPGHRAAGLIVASEKTKSAGNYYHGSETVSIGILGEETIAAIRQTCLDLTRRHTEIADELLTLNVKTEITISDGDYKYLRDEGVI